MGCVAQAQFDVGNLVGTIRDQSGAAVAGAPPTQLLISKVPPPATTTVTTKSHTEMYNAFNRTNLYPPASGRGVTPGGAPSSGGSISSTFEPHIIQFGLKILY
jgi:hypothetical protein